MSVEDNEWLFTGSRSMLTVKIKMTMLLKTVCKSLWTKIILKTKSYQLVLNFCWIAITLNMIQNTSSQKKAVYLILMKNSNHLINFRIVIYKTNGIYISYISQLWAQLK